jgi:formylglycine-generating enzyme required for sulfatase activity/predicted nucleotidyltransferase
MAKGYINPTLFLSNIQTWAQRQPRVGAVLLVGSHARGTAGPDSDVDLVLLLDDPQVFLADTGWVHSFGEPVRQQVEQWGKVTSLRVWYADGREVEYGLTGLDWGSDPTDEGDMRVIRDGIRILYQRTRTTPMNVPLQEFEYETVRVNDRGEVIQRQTHQARRFVEELASGVTLEMVAVPGGRFLMGSRAGRGYADEEPQHSVKVPAFFMGQYPVTQEQWEAVMEWRPPYRCQGAKRPADRVSWFAAREFCERLSAKTGRAYRLPGEAEWEYACRAGTTTPFHFGKTITTDVANYVGEHTYLSEPTGVYRHQTTQAGAFPPNTFGLYDMHGNVWEWCADAWHDNYVGAPGDGSVWESDAAAHRVLRGGCWHDPPGLCRSATRLKSAPGEGEDFFGLRVALESPE